MRQCFLWKIDDDHYCLILKTERMGDDYVKIPTEEHFRLMIVE